MTRYKTTKPYLFSPIKLCYVLIAMFVQMHIVHAQTGDDIRTQTVTIGFTNEPLREALFALGRTGNFQLALPSEADATRLINLPRAERTIEATLNLMLQGSDLEFQVQGNSIVLSVKREAPPVPTDPPLSTQTRTITGVVVDEFSEPLPFVTVAIPGTTTGTVTGIDGRFSITIPQATQELHASFVGFRTTSIPLTATANYTIVLEPEALTLDQVVIVGTFERDAESFTGSFNTVTGAELRQIGSQNVIQSLRSLDPSFLVLDNIAAGADPNAMPTIEIRGQTSIDFAEVGEIFGSDPNQPLFILDGFETTLQRIVDLDPNRVASITVLKDAASTAFYGSRAANGVVVVETVRGAPGRMRVFYGSDWSIQVPNIRSYNMMNAEEKLLFELLSGRYTFQGPMTNMDAVLAQAQLDAMYAQRLAEVRRGVNSDWLREPLRTAFINRQSLRISGGTEELMINVGVSYRNAPGVMIGSSRDSWTGDIDLTFNRGNFSFVNLLGISGFTAVESPFGNFAEWVRTNPYYRMRDSDGQVTRYLDIVYGMRYHPQSGMWGRTLERLFTVANPLYNATLPHSRHESRGINIDERLRARWNFHQGMTLEGLVQITAGTVNTVQFIPPEHTQFAGQPFELQGRYISATQENVGYVANLMYIWMNRVHRHHYVINVRGEIGHQSMNLSRWEATGFPFGSIGEPSFAISYGEGRPFHRSSVTRRANFLVSANYSYNMRYLFDATFRYDGSTVFGSARRFTPFWSVGTGWNMHEEDFLRGINWIRRLRLRATIGQTGNQNIGMVASSSTFTYLPGGNLFGTGILLSQLGNPYIEWQKTTTGNLALDIGLFDYRFIGRFEVYQKRTNPLVVSVDQSPSMGTTRVPMSLGQLYYRGFEFEGTYHVIRQRNVNWRLRLMGTVLRGEYRGFSDKLENMNQAMQESGVLRRFTDGHSPRTLWAVRSLGIDQATGREVFQDRYGRPTFVYNPADIVAIGKGEAAVLGTISSFFTFRQITLTVVMRYSLGEEVFNSALFNKVENISMNEVAFNQDRRALTDRWRQPGDEAQFRGISLTDVTPMSSRFIQTENFLSAESIGIMWRVNRYTNPWLRNLRMERLDINATAGGTGGVFRLSNVRRERGINFPEASIFTIAINAVF